MSNGKTDTMERRQRHIEGLMRSHQAQMDRLRSYCETLSNEGSALRECLGFAGLLRPEQFESRLHRVRFAKVLRRYPLSRNEVSVASFDAVLMAADLIHALIPLAGLAAARSCAAVSRSLHRGVGLKPPRLYAIGGLDGSRSLADGERYDDRSQRWEAIAPMLTPRSNLVACAWEGSLYAIGGTDGGQVLGALERFVEAENRWESLPEMPTPRSGMAAAVCNGSLYVIGGREGFRSLGTVERFEIAERSWEPLPPMEVSRRFLAATVLSGRLYAVGGEDDAFAALATAERLTLDAEAVWEHLPPMPTRRRGLAAAALRGRLFAVGGGQAAAAQKSTALMVVECFDAVIGAWETLPVLPAPRVFLAAAALSGSLFVLGGSDGSQAHRSVDRLVAGTWKSMRPMDTRRAFFAAAVMHAYR
eukprot:TRINITY_DN72681_c0_g1_i1.p1 TRINITY_DN72681_c0_g1~~TRINITY_DN72681_c0_g1_i1.p1  ORF type:complete len:418 (-),score=79.13 TRINITY_DN72681_c0_g1_i1:73-1326(-)